ncbi:Lactosylceramide 4-alpha-galactosyltransferase [Echria macrotheca]|uniref:Lactosylceramide 4-alpha-galactosyltransferase n=1 Tax=Echria macrotheca TaxID=438768 RepID=A0AAJ0BFF6_9PEZI|nr:Lactosylceramide 4-alpha-galactosyltransferase [Echria macrotheca]
MRFSWRRRLLLISAVAIGLGSLAYGILFVVFPPRFPYPTFRFVSLADDACDNALQSADLSSARPIIPNIVHYVWILKDPAELVLGFKVFVSVYSAHYYFRPDRIYLHTDAAPHVIEHARKKGSEWTKRVLALPGVTVNHVEAPRYTKKGVKLDKLEHRSDFVRLQALREYGGVYLDADAMPLRDVAELRNSGFRNVVGQQTGLAMWFHGYINNGVMFSVPNSTLMTLFYHAAHEFYDGEWDTASIKLLTDLANRLAAIPSEVLILQPQAFGPTSWERKDQERLFRPTPLDSTAPGLEEHETEQRLRNSTIQTNTCQNMLAWLKHREQLNERLPDTKLLDFTSTYILHAVDNHAPAIIGNGRGVDVEYILARQSSYARALFPAIRNAVLEGIVPKPEGVNLG